MPRRTRRAVLATVGAAVASPGCLSALDRPSDGTGTERPTTATTTEETTAGETTTERPPTDATTGDWIERASNSPDPDHDVVAENDADESGRLRVAVVREATGETVFETTVEVRPGGERVVYNLREADPEGVETFRVCAELVGPGGTTTGGATGTGAATEAGTGATSTAGTAGTASPHRDCATVDTSECYGNAYPTLAEDGTVQVIYAIC